MVEGKAEAVTRGSARAAHSEFRAPDGVPTPADPSFTLALPGPAPIGVPNFFIDKFRIPPFLLPIYQAAGIQYGVRWEVLAAINEIETDYGRNLNVSTAGAVGWMQFLPSTWKRWGVDANRDKRKDPYNPVDAIFAAARYLKAAGADQDLRKAVFAYNHADWYVDSVLMRAQLIGGLPADLVGSLTGLTQGHFPVAAKSRYADDLNAKDATKRVKRGNAAVRRRAPTRRRRGINIFSKPGAAVIAVNDGVVKKHRPPARASAATWSSRTCTATATPTATSQGRRRLPGAQGAQGLQGADRARAEAAQARVRARPARQRGHPEGAAAAKVAAAPPRPSRRRRDPGAAPRGPATAARDAPRTRPPPPLPSPSSACSPTPPGPTPRRAGGERQMRDLPSQRGLQQRLRRLHSPRAGPQPERRRAQAPAARRARGGRHRSSAASARPRRTSRRT